MNFGWRISPSTVPWPSCMIFGRNIDTLLALHLQLLARFGALRCGAANPMDLGVSCVGSALLSIGCGVPEDAAPLRSNVRCSSQALVGCGSAAMVILCLQLN